VGITHYPTHPRDRGQFFRRSLRVATSDENAAPGIFPAHATDRGPCVLVRALRDGAGIEDDHFGIARRGSAFHSALQELALERGAVSLGGAAAKILYVEAGHAPILTECRPDSLVRRTLAHLPEVLMKRRILLVDDDPAVLLTLKAVLEFHGFEVETATSAKEAVVRLESATYHMVISDLRMDTEDAGLRVIAAARQQKYDPATALLTAFPSSGESWEAELSDSLLIKPLGIKDLLRQVEAILVRHADARQARLKGAVEKTQESPRKAS
jgi:CheY-like chemotaxis protein